MHAIIPTAGFGTRLRPHTYSQPKVLLTVAGRPIIAHILDDLFASGVTSATIVIGYLGDAIEKFVRERYPERPINFVVQPELLGLGHSIWVARDFIPTDGEPLLIVLGDTIFDVDLKPVFEANESAIGVFYVDDPRRFGVVETEGKYVSRLVEKPEHPKTNLMIAGLYFFRDPQKLRTSLDTLVSSDKRTKNEYQLTDALQMMVEGGEKFATFMLQGWFDCGKPETLLSTNRALLAKRSQRLDFPNVIINEPVYIASTARIENSVIGPFASIGENTAIRNAIVRDSIIGDAARVEGVLLDQSIVGNSATVLESFRRMNVGDSSEVEL